MATFTSRIRLEKQDNGANSGTWGTVLNQNVIDLVDEAIAGYTIVSCSSAPITLSSNNLAISSPKLDVVQFLNFKEH